MPDIPSKDPIAISGMFNRIAPSYDWLNTVMTGGMHHRWKALATQKLRLQAGQHVLDVCTGTGDLAGLFAQRVGPSGQVVGLDFSEQMLATAQRRFPTLRFVQGDAMALPFEDNAFDAAMISFGLRNVQDPQVVLSEMARVVRPGGIVLNLDTASNNQNPLFWFYFQHVMPRLGQWLAGDREAYAYLCRSTQTFATPSAIMDMMLQAGLSKPQQQGFGFGSVSAQWAIKPA